MRAVVRVCAFAMNVMLIAASIACRATPSDASGQIRVVERVGVAMGSELRLSAWSTDEAAARSAFEAVFAEFERLEALMSTWRPASDVVRINAAAGVQAVAVAPEVRDVLRQARQISEWTDGTFDVTFGALTDIWKFDHDQDNSIPAAEAIRERLPLIDYRQIEIDDRAGTVFLRRKGMKIHLGGIGKGYAVDRAVSDSSARRPSQLHDPGGRRSLCRRPEGRPSVAARHQRSARAGRATASPRSNLSDSTFSTSGDYARFFMKDGVRYHHILDPSTGQPARLCRSVTIVADNPVLADAIAKGVFILGPEKGMALVERIPKLEAVIVTAKNEVLVSSGLKERFVLVHPPTDAP